MASSNPNIVLLESNDGGIRPVFERIAAATILPGDLIELNSSGQVTPVASAGKVNACMIALENPFAPDPTQPALTQSYAANDMVRYVFAQRGDLINARLAASQTVAIGDTLAPSATGGCLAKITIDATTLAGAPVGVAEAAVTTTGAVGRVRVRIM